MGYTIETADALCAIDGIEPNMQDIKVRVHIS